MLWFEIAIVILSFLAFLAAGASAGKQALAFGRTARRSQERILGKTDALLQQSETIQNWTVTLAERQAFLQGRLDRLRLRLAKMAVLLHALADAKHRIDPYFRYLGIW